MCVWHLGTALHVAVTPSRAASHPQSHSRCWCCHFPSGEHPVRGGTTPEGGFPGVIASTVTGTLALGPQWARMKLPQELLLLV